RNVAQDIDRLSSTAFFDGPQFLRCAVTTRGAGQSKPPVIGKRLEGFYQPRDVLSALDRAHEQGQVFARPSGPSWQMHAVRNHADTSCRDLQQVFDLLCGELRDGDHQVTLFPGPPGLLGEPIAEVGRRVIARHDEKVVKSGYGSISSNV